MSSSPTNNPPSDADDHPSDSDDTKDRKKVVYARKYLDPDLRQFADSAIRDEQKNTAVVLSRAKGSLEMTDEQKAEFEVAQGEEKRLDIRRAAIAPKVAILRAIK
jgi:hypothetical protein